MHEEGTLKMNYTSLPLLSFISPAAGVALQSSSSLSIFATEGFFFPFPPPFFREAESCIVGHRCAGLFERKLGTLSPPTGPKPMAPASCASNTAHRPTAKQRNLMNAAWFSYESAPVLLDTVGIVLLDCTGSTAMYWQWYMIVHFGPFMLTTYKAFL